MSKKILSCVFVALLASVSYGLELGAPQDDAVHVIYSPDSGDLLFKSTAGAVTTFELKSAGGLFTDAPQPLLNGLFDVNSTVKKFKLEPAGFEELNLAGAMQPGLSPDALLGDLALDGSFAAGGALSTKANVLVVPEPSSLALIAFGLLGVLGFRRK